MGQKYHPATDGIDEKIQRWQWSGQGASKHLEAETPPDRLAFFYAKPANPNLGRQYQRRNLDAVIGEKAYFAGCGRNVQGASLKTTSSSSSCFEHPAFSVGEDAK